MAYHVIIIEDDPMVAAIDRQYVETDQCFQVDQVLKNGVEGLEYLETHPVDLVILDYYTPNMNGMEFVDRMHLKGWTPDVIMVTSASDTEIVRALLSRGVLDYLVKPFEFARFRQALDKFLQVKRLLEAGEGSLDQRTIDQLMQPKESEGRSAALSKGLNLATLQLIRGFLAENRGKAYTSEQIAEQVHLSRITIRRYVNHMVEAGELVSSIDYQTGGRPSIQYSYTGT